MENAIYASLTRQTGLMREMRSIANNIANSNTTGFRREGVVFAEHLAAVGRGTNTLSMAHARGREIDLRQAPLAQTNGTFDLALEGEGFFMVETPEGNQLTRAGAFLPAQDGTLMNADGYRLLDEGQAPIILPAGNGHVSVAADGTVSANGQPIARVGVFVPAEGAALDHHSGTLFVTDDEPEAVANPKMRQGFLEESNVQPVFEITRMIEVQRAYELGQSFLDREDRRIRDSITAMTR